MLKFLGLMDFATFFIMLGAHFNLIGVKLIVLASMYMFFKSYFFRGDWNSFVDLIVGLYLLLMALGVTSFVTYLFALYLFQKSYVSISA